MDSGPLLHLTSPKEAGLWHWLNWQGLNDRRRDHGLVAAEGGTKWTREVQMRALGGPGEFGILVIYFSFLVKKGRVGQVDRTGPHLLGLAEH